MQAASRRSPPAAAGSASPGRIRRTRPSVLRADRIATATITFGGGAVILAVAGILVYLVAVAWPLFGGARLSPPLRYDLVAPDAAPDVLMVEVDEYRALGFLVGRDGRLLAFSARDGRTVETTAIFEPPAALTAWSRSPHDGRTAFGFADGSVLTGSIAFETSYPAPDGVPEPVSGLEPGGAAVQDGGIVERTSGGELRRVSIRLEPFAPFGPAGAATGAAPPEGRPDGSAPPPEAPGRAAVELLDLRTGEAVSRLAVLAGGELAVHEILERENFLTGEVTAEVSSRPVPLPETPPGGGAPRFLLVTTPGDALYLAWEDGTTLRWNLRDPAQAELVERADLVPDPGARLTALAFSLGEQSLLAGDSLGGLRGWFRVAREGAGLDGHGLVMAHLFPPAPAEIRTIGTSLRDRTIVAGCADGSLLLQHTTSEQVLARARFEPSVAVPAAQITPKGDGLFAFAADGRAALWGLSNPHPETTLRSIFGRVWYEGHPEPSFTWQSSSGTDDFEPKLSLIPLIFGTFKATLYAMLFAAPIALAGALYTSEFLDRRWRVPVKSAVELMASLPSVVLGFIAALVLAPLVENWVLAVMIAFGLIPVASLAFGFAWQALPRRLTASLEGRPQILLLAGVVLLAALAAPAAGGAVESALFSGDFKAWLDGRVGDGAPGTALLVWPFLFAGLLLADGRYLSPALERRLAGLPRSGAAALLGVKFLLLVALSLAAAWLAASVVAAAGIDPRGLLLGTYVQRNALIVGFAMGFAVIPIIYTIAEDALTAVPESLRSASLGCGATRWQTATRVVLPVALSGIFSALMIGLGRAVGETMIVLMAAGNTPLMDLNIFNGLRTLSANIAVELPEAVRDGTLYRMLFLAALTLFALTAIVNTVAEIVRLRFRRRAMQL